jgi:fermentation-respiration switch protein FrsA (DUF1100 family)
MLLTLFLLLVLLGLLAAGYYFARVIRYPKVTDFDLTRAQSVEFGWLIEKEYDSWPVENLRIRSPFGYDLSGVYHPLDGSQRTVIITHGITFSRFGVVKYAMLFRKRGFNVLLYDLRFHGQSGGPDTSFGFYEKWDLKAVADWAFARLGKDGMVGAMGESLGAATSLQYAGIDPRTAFVVADCSFSSLPKLLAYRLRKEYHLPPFPLLPVAGWFVRLGGGWPVDSASPIHAMPRVEAPIFFIHGQKDTYIPPDMSQELFAAKQRGIRKIYLAPNAGHVESLVKNPVEYEHKLGEFLKEIGL